MERVCEFLKDAGVYYLCTLDGDQPTCRPFGTYNIFEGKFYIQTGKIKNVSKQIMQHPKVAICVMKGPTWMRLTGELVEDDRDEARAALLDAHPYLKKNYAADDGNTQVFYFRNATAEFNSFGKEPEIVRF